MEDIRNGVKSILRELHPEVDFETEDALTEKQILDSFDMVSLIARLREEYGIVVTADKIIPAHFHSLDAICALIGTLR